MKIRPINYHLVIEPMKHEAFMASQKDSYEERGTVLEVQQEVKSNLGIVEGDVVLFDAWLAKKYPGETPDTFYWLVEAGDIVAILYED